jgi:two-component system CheB/CheR fusion protein
VSLQINQLFYNLIGNALKFSRPDVPPVIHISCRTLAAGEAPERLALNAGMSYYDITFQDNGIGIDEKFTEKIFMIFQRLNAREKFEGTGIGLALCKKIVLGHQGEIYVTSVEEKGSQFHVLLPVAQ